MVKVKKDLTGQKFARLTVLRQTEDYVKPNGKRESRWLCLCDCGNITEVTGYNLKNNSVSSCGCLNTETVIRRCKKYNTYDLSNDFGIGYTSKGEKFLFDLEDYCKIKDYCWNTNNRGYVCSRKNRKIITLHRTIINPPNNMFIDHINHQRTDNRKENLRICTMQENNINRSIQSNNKSGITGVWFDKSRNRWTSELAYGGKTKFRRNFKNLDDAIAARREAEKKYFGEYRCDEHYSTNLKILERNAGV